MKEGALVKEEVKRPDTTAKRGQKGAERQGEGTAVFECYRGTIFFRLARRGEGGCV